MAALVVFAVALFIGTVSSASTANRIVGGEPTTIDKYPSIVQVEFLGVFTGIWSQSCAANILTTRYVVSAAHCFEGQFYIPERRRIRAGATYRNTGGIVHDVEYEMNHPSYGAQGLDGDISIVRLLVGLIYSPVVQPGAIIYQDGVIPDNMPVVHAGWGAIYQQGPASPELRDVTIYTINHEICRARYLSLPTPMIVTENMICAGLLDVGGRDACQGDSGGPLYYSDIIIGVVSWGLGCANATYPGVSTAVAPYTNWIISVAT